MTICTVPPDDESPVEIELRKLDSLLNHIDSSAWEIGDLLLKLTVEPFEKDLRDIAKRYINPVTAIVQNGRSYSRLSEFRTLAATVKPADRNPSIPFYTYQTVVKAAKSIERNAKKELGVDYKVDIQKEISEISQLGPDRSASREVARAMAAKSRDELMPERHKNAIAALATVPPDTINNCHFGDYVEVLAKMPEGSIKVLFMDPPYFGYKHDSLQFSSSSSNQFSANQDGTSAKATTLAAFELAATRLMKNGVILLWQVGSYLHPDIIAEVTKYGFRIGYPIIWDKVRPQPGDQVSPVSVSTEFCWPIYRETDQLWNLNMQKRSQTHYANRDMAAIAKTNPWPLVAQSAYSLIEKHNFEKPMESNVDLMELFTVENELIFETHGCSGGMSVAAIHGKRQWVYCESLDANFKLGFSRIQAAKESFERSKLNPES